jgi:integrase/recombinase XerD
MEGSRNIKNSMHHLFRALQRIYPQIKNARQIRQSVITHWLGSKNLRQVQYMAGHRWVSSTERYQQNNIEDLQKDINRYHPLKF